MNNIAVITIPVSEWEEQKAMIKGLCENVKKLIKKEEKELLTIPEARDLLSVGKTTMERYINEGVFEIVKMTEKDRAKRYIRRSEIEDKMNQIETR